MKKSILTLTAGLILLTTTLPAFAKTVYLEGDAALKFYDRHGDELENDGTKAWQGVFHYVNKNGEIRKGIADCWIQPEGEAIWCTITY